MSDLLSRSVARAKMDFESWRMRKPTKLLLGKREMEWLDQVVKNTPMVATCYRPREQYQGLDIYSVDDAEFLGVV